MTKLYKINTTRLTDEKYRGLIVERGNYLGEFSGGGKANSYRIVRGKYTAGPYGVGRSINLFTTDVTQIYTNIKEAVNNMLLNQ